MGVSCMSSSASSYDNTKSPTIIDPNRFEVLGIETLCRPYCILLLKYDCASFEGLKLAVYKNVNVEDEVVARDCLDPHFSRDFPEISPIARFRPTLVGLAMARTLCKHLFINSSIHERQGSPCHTLTYIDESKLAPVD